VTAKRPRTVALSDAELRLLARWAAACAARSLPLFEAIAPRDMRPRTAIEAARRFSRGGKRTAELRRAALAAFAAAREIDDPVAHAAARAAGASASIAYTHPIATPHQINHIVAPAGYAARARELAAHGETSVGDRLIAWALGRTPPALRRVVRRFPRRHPGKSRLDQLFEQADAGLRGR